MSIFPLDEIVTAWLNAKRQCEQLLPESRILQQAILQSLASGQPISARQAAADTGISMDIVHAHFEQFRTWGAEFDESGNLTGMVLSLAPTPHRFYVNGRELYAWCALDTLFLPGLIGQLAEVESTCPVTGISIRLTVTPTGVSSVSPSGTVLSVVVPGISAVCEACQQDGVAREVCHTMHFFGSPEATAKWSVAHPDVAILTVAEAWQLVNRVWIEPAQ